MHVGNSSAGCNAETAIHKLSKRLLRERMPYPMVTICHECKDKNAFVLPNGDEFREEVHLDAISRKPDIVILRDAQPVGCIEVVHTHACDNAKLEDLCRFCAHLRR